MNTLFLRPGRLAIMLGTAAFLVAMPATFEFGTDAGLISVKSAQALAKSGSGGSGSGGNDDDDDDDDDNSGSGSSDDDGDDDDDDDDDDYSGGTPGTGTPGTGTPETGTGGATGGGVSVTRFETSSAGVEVSFSDGTREEIENGRYERKNAAGRTVEERPATQADIDRLLSLR